MTSPVHGNDVVKIFMNDCALRLERDPESTGECSANHDAAEESSIDEPIASNTGRSSSDNIFRIQVFQKWTSKQTLSGTVSLPFFFTAAPALPPLPIPLCTCSWQTLLCSYLTSGSHATPALDLQNQPFVRL